MVFVLNFRVRNVLIPGNDFEVHCMLWGFFSVSYWNTHNSSAVGMLSGELGLSWQIWMKSWHDVNPRCFCLIRDPLPKIFTEDLTNCLVRTVNTRNYNQFTDSRTLQFSTALTKSSQASVLSLVLLGNGSQHCRLLSFCFHVIIGYRLSHYSSWP
jgi:hypothetical protein